jgi:repressor LexA
MPKDSHKQLGAHLLENLEVKPDSLGEALSELYKTAGDYLKKDLCGEAFQCCKTALNLCDELKSGNELKNSPDTTYAKAIFYVYMGTSYSNQEKLEDALDCYRKSRAHFQGNLWHDRWNEGLLWHTMGKLYQATDNLGNAFLAFQQSLFCLQSVNSADKDSSDLIADTKAELKETSRLLRDSLKSKVKPHRPTRVKPPDIKPEDIKIIPLVAKIAAGSPILAEQNIEGYLFLDKDYTKDVTFALQVQGDSMVNAGILNKDIVFIKEQSVASSRDIVAVMLTDIDTEATLKRFFKEDSHIRLQPENDAEKPIIIVHKQHDLDPLKALYQQKGIDAQFMTGVEVGIAGKVVGVLRAY